MKVEIIKGVIANGEPQVPGAVIEVDDAHAKAMIYHGRAVPYVEKAEPVAEVEEEAAPAAKPKRKYTRKAKK